MSKESQAVILSSNLPALLNLAGVASSILLSCVKEGMDLLPQEIADDLALIGSEIQRKVRMYNENPFALLNEELAVTYIQNEEGCSRDDCDVEYCPPHPDYPQVHKYLLIYKHWTSSKKTY